jgi:hypothetical protein
MDRPSRDDFFTLIHKGLRRELFAITTLAATMDWDDPEDVTGFDASWQDVHHLLDVHALHEDDHFLPLIADVAPDLLAAVGAAHHDLDEALADVAALIRGAVAAPDGERGLRVHRELSAFVAGYLVHLLDEETTVMPTIWEHCTDEELARARASFMRSMSPADASLSRRVMLPAMAPSERAAVLTTMRASAPPPVFTAALDDARALLDGKAWRRLAEDLALG